MNSTAASDTARIPLGCDPIIPHGTLDPKNTPEAYGWLVFIAVMSAITCPLTVVMNALIIIAVKTKPRVKTKSNIALACLSTTDLAMGVIGQALFISGVIAELQGYASSTYCLRKELGVLAIALSGNASLFHIILVNAEKYIAIRRPLQYETLVTEARLIGSSALLWITVLFIQLIMPAANIDDQTNAQVDGRQKKKIAVQQVSLEAKEKFLKQKKAFKVTVTVLCFLILCFLPITFSRILMVNSVVNSVNLLFIFHFTGVLVITLNSLVNPIIYCVRIRQFQVALIQLLTRKDAGKAENIERRFFRRVNRVAPENLESRLSG
ncbi:uncharacterized protein [Porites lutea]|uniref:uncharacterized protein n=1 Tax=Porites lutea TaxID=51062 RepID=UPI003CC5B2B0